MEPFIFVGIGVAIGLLLAFIALVGYTLYLMDHMWS